MPSSAIVDLVGQTFGCWKVISLHGKPSSNLHHCQWTCECECGLRKIRTGSNLKKSINVRGCHCGFSHRKRPYEALYNTLLKLAERRNLPVQLSYEEYLEFTQQKECHYCGEPLFWYPYNTMNGHKLDRKDHRDWYYKENCVVCCPRCNRAKSNHFSYDEWVQIGALIRSWRGPQ